MQTLAEELNIIIAASLLLLLITSFVVVFVLLHEKRRKQYEQDKLDLRNQFEKEILKSKLEMQEETLNKVSLELHDNIGQSLSLAKLNLESSIDHQNKVKIEKVQSAQSLLRGVIDELRDLSHLLNSNVIGNQTTSQLIVAQVDSIKKLGLLDVELSIHGEEFTIEAERQLILFRIVQEVFNNALKHSKAKKISTELSFEGDNLRLEISDNGVGFDFKSTSDLPTAGLANLKYRAELIDAELEIQSAMGKGTRAIVSMKG